MQKYLDSFLNYVTDKTRSISSRAALVVVVILGIFLADNLTGFSFYYSSGKKIEQMHKINALLTESSLDSNSRKTILQLRQRTINRQTAADYIRNFFNSLTLKSTRSVDVQQKEDNQERNTFWHIITSGGFFIFAGLIAIPLLLFVTKGGSVLQRLATIAVFLILMAVGTFFYSSLFGLIPRLGKTWTANYIVNGVLQTILGWGLISAEKFAKRKLN